jgi:segregation and condensation protein B
MAEDLVNALECLLFVSEEPLSSGRLASLLETDEAEVAALADELSRRLNGSGLQVTRIAGGYKLSTRPEYAPWIERFREPEETRLSKAALETIAIIAYRQPITQPEIEAIRGVDSSGVVATLLEKGLITTAGRKRAPGRPFLYRTTTQFLAAFGLHDLSELPMLDSLRQASEAAFGIVSVEEPEVAFSSSAGEPSSEDAGTAQEA